jgi:epoxyqueuosine reductase
VSVIEKHTAFIKSLAANLGFDYCGIAKAQLLDEDARRLEQWLSKGMHGSMQYFKTGARRKICYYFIAELLS